jgi:hypothetical protein
MPSLLLEADDAIAICVAANVTDFIVAEAAFRALKVNKGLGASSHGVVHRIACPIRGSRIVTILLDAEMAK